MEKKKFDDFNTVNDWTVNITEKTKILGSPYEKQRSLSKQCYVIIGLAVLIVVMILFGIHWQFGAVNERPDPEVPLPPPKMPMRLYGKAAVVSQGGPCPQIGVNVMSKGGNAVDAIIATMLCEGVTGIQNMGLGGGFIMSFYNATTKKVISINSRVVAPLDANQSMYDNELQNSLYGALAAAVPGELRGYSTIYKLYGGGVPWESLFESTIALCENGIKINRHLFVSLRARETTLIQDDPILRETFFNEKTGHAKQEGEIFKLPKLAKTLRIIAKEGADALYNGSLTSRFVEDVKKANGIISEKDLANYKVDIQDTHNVKLKNGHTIHAGPPPSSGIILAYILRLLDGILPAPDAALDAHRLVEACKYGYAERTHLGDHKFVNVSQIFDKVKSDAYMDGIQKKISDNFTSLDPTYYGADYYIPEDHGTANTVVIDPMGNVVVGTSTINTIFGSGFVSPSTGILLNSEMDSFSAPGHVSFYKFPSSPANFMEPGKRPMSSMSPTIFTDENDNFVLGIGAAGGSKITLSTAYASALKLWFKKTLKQALDEPRIYHQLMPMEIQYEYGMTKAVVQKLTDIGHPMARLKYAGVSSATAIAISPSGMIEAMPDSRRPGNSSGY